MVDADKLKPGDLVGVNKDSYLILDTLPAEYDSRVKAMEVGDPRWAGRPGRGLQAAQVLALAGVSS